MNRFLRISLISAVVSAVVYVGAALVMVFWPAPTFDTDPFPALQNGPVEYTPLQFTMRDGEMLFARQYPADADRTILLLHGVTADSSAFNPGVAMLQEASGAELIALDLRGHGQSGGERGDIDYIGQYQDDVADVLAALRAERPHNRILLAGHSMGGGIALQYGMLEDAPVVDGYLMFAPHLGSDAPTMPQPDPKTAELAAAYSQLHVPRLIGLIMLNSVRITALEHLDTLFFNLTDEVTHTYSFAATANSSPQDYAAGLAAVDAPLLVVVGENDEAFVAEAYPTAVTAHSAGEVHIIDDVDHNGILRSREAMMIIENWLDETQPAADQSVPATVADDLSLP